MIYLKKHIIIIISIAALVIGIIVALTFAINMAFQHEEPLVYITRTGEKYHSKDCGYLWASAIPIGLNQAKQAGYTMCSRCGGKAIGTITVNNYGASFAISFLIILALAILFLIIYNKKVDNSLQKKDGENTIYLPTKNNSNHDKQKINLAKQSCLQQSLFVNVGDLVLHKSFGEGKIIQIERNYITVHFLDKDRKFIFPDAFVMGFLELK